MKIEKYGMFLEKQGFCGCVEVMSVIHGKEPKRDNMSFPRSQSRKSPEKFGINSGRWCVVPRKEKRTERFKP